MTLQEAKDQVARNYKLFSWEEAVALNPSFESTQWTAVAELYARSKWDEAATLTNRNIIHHTNLTLNDLPAKPEFKP
jgi:hypothetical protein